ncbi:MAG TPA: TIGR00341 family protein [Cyanothece sp. UBA12306]|nr:TIGR00341 family protein [Cyanothece sp. UBA12306]
MKNWIKKRIPQVSRDNLVKLQQELLEESQLQTNFVILTLSSCIIASLGLLMNSTAVIIGAMLIAPLMLPLRGLALGALDTDGQLLRTSLLTLGIGTLVSILVSGLVGGLFGVPATSFGTEILSRTQPNLADLMVAFVAGGISGFAKVSSRISDALAGTAISVALMPPLCVVGISLSQQDWQLSSGSFLLYLTNFLGITLSCLLVFTWGGYYLNSSRTSQALGGFLAMTGLLIFPLFISFWNLIQQERVEAEVKEILQKKTITVGQQTELIQFQVNWPNFPWSKQSPKVILTVQENADNPVTPNQVRLVETLLERYLGKKFRLIFRASALREVRSDNEDILLPAPLLGPIPTILESNPQFNLPNLPPKSDIENQQFQLKSPKKSP